MRIVRAECVLEIVLKRRSRTRCKIPQKPNQERRVNWPMRQPSNIVQWMMSFPALVADIVKHAGRPPKRVNGDRGHYRGTNEKQDSDRLIGVLSFEHIAEAAT